MRRILSGICLLLALTSGEVAHADPAPTPVVPAGFQRNVILRWNQALLQAIRDNIADPPMTARALGIAYTCAYDAWAAYDDRALGTRFRGSLRRPVAERTLANKAAAISYAVHMAASDLYPKNVPQFDGLLRQLGHDPASTAAKVGKKACAAVLDLRRHDGANQLGDLAPGRYADYTGYQSVNEPMAVESGFDPATVKDPNRWQPLVYTDRDATRPTLHKHMGPHFGWVLPFAFEVDAAGVEPPVRYGTQAYADQAAEIVRVEAELTDRQKVIAEYWADGPHSEMPPGHWSLLSEYVSFRDRHTLDDDVRMYFAIGNAVMDSGIACWRIKRLTDAVRPITAIRYLYRGRTIPGWRGPGLGVGPIKGETWRPYQASWFTTPPFSEYVSGHSSFSAAVAEVLKRFTGSDAFGASTTIPAGWSFAEPGITPREPVTLSWPTFSAAADEAGISRRYGGIHFPDADMQGRRLGRKVGAAVWDKALSLWKGVS